MSYLGLAERKGGLYRMKVYMLYAISPFLIFSTRPEGEKRLSLPQYYIEPELLFEPDLFIFVFSLWV